MVSSGPVGCGKTAFLQQVAERAVRHGLQFFSATASESERRHPWGVIGQLVDAMRAAGMADPGLETGERAEWTASAHFTLLQNFCRAVGDFAETTPIAIGIDDAHFADQLSLECLGYLIRRIESSSILIVMTESPCHEAPLTVLHSGTLHLRYCHRVMLAPLSMDGITELVTERLGGQPAPELTMFCAEVSGGNPLLLHGLIEDHRGADPTPDVPEPGPWFRQAVLRCLHRCTPQMLAVARAVAVLAESATSSLIAELLGESATAVHSVLLDLRATGLLTGEEFRHPAARLAVLADIPPEELPELHSRAAELLHETGAPATVVADQLLAAQDPVKAAWRVAILREAARLAMAVGNAPDAVRSLRHAARLCTSAAQRAQITALLADTQWHLDPATATRYLPDLSHDVQAGLLTGADALVPVRQLIWQGDFAQADALHRVIDDREAETGNWLRAGPEAMTISRWWVAFCQRGPVRDLGVEVGRRLGFLAPWPEPAGPRPGLLAPGDRTDDAEWVEFADQTLQGISGDSFAPALLALALVIHLDRPDEALQWSQRLLGQDWVTQVPVRRAVIETVRSIAALRGGDPAVAMEAALSSLDALAPRSWGVMVGIPVSVLVEAALMTSDLRGAASALNLPVPSAMFGTPLALPYLLAAGRYHLAVGRPQTALSHFQKCGDLAETWELDGADVIAWRTDAAAALTAIGEDRKARELLEDQLSRLGDRQSRARGIALRRLAAVVPFPARRALLREAVEILTSCTDRLELRHARADLATVLEATTGRRRTISTGRGPADEEGAASRENETGPAGTRGSADGAVADGGPAGLTDAERRVAALAAAGATNREIAGELFVTVSTVEQHLTKIYRKLNVQRRSALPVGILREPE